jgi:hypothetical protein
MPKKTTVPPATAGTPRRSWCPRFHDTKGTRPQLFEVSRTFVARDRVERWLGTLDSEGALLDGSISDHATLLLSLVDGLSLQIVTPDSGMTVHMARHILSITIARAVIDSGT